MLEQKWDEALEQFEISLGFARERATFLQTRGEVLTRKAQVFLARGELDHALATVDEGIALAVSNGVKPPPERGWAARPGSAPESSPAPSAPQPRRASS